MGNVVPGDLLGICIAILMVITVLAITYVAVQFHIKRNRQKQAIEYIRNGAKSALVEAGLEIFGINQNDIRRLRSEVNCLNGTDHPDGYYIGMVTLRVYL